METREELLSKLIQAQQIIGKLEDIDNRLNQTRSQYQSTKSEKKFKKIHTILLVIWIIISLAIGNTMMQVGPDYKSVAVKAVILYLIMGGAIYLFNRFRNNQKNQAIRESNSQILKNNEILKNQEQAIINELKAVQDEYAQNVSAWYPPKYVYSDACAFFIDALTNYRAESTKELINLYENAMHQQRVEDMQKASLRQQKIQTLLSAGSLMVQGAQLAESSKQTAAMQQSSETLDQMHRMMRGF